MFALLCNKIPHLLSPLVRNFCDFRVLECTPFIITRSFSSTISDQNQLKQTSFTASYLINSCGLSLEEANSASKKVCFKTLERPDSVLALFKTHGFSNSQITNIVKTIPRILSYNSDKYILPKLRFFSSIGNPGTDLAKLISLNPRLLEASLSNRIIPLYKFFKNTQGFDDYTVIKAMINASRFFRSDVAIISANVLSSREVGMPESVIEKLVRYRFNLLCYRVDTFQNKIKKIIDMGFCPTETKFIYALAAVLCLSESTWQRKIEIYGRCGWSKDEIMSAFKKDPQCMAFSENKILNSMDFLVEVMDMKPSAVAANPHILFYSLKKKIIPRGLVVKILMSKGIWDNNFCFYSVLCFTDERFSERYVEKHREQIPYLVDVFEGRMSAQQLGFQFVQGPCEHVDLSLFPPPPIS